MDTERWNHDTKKGLCISGNTCLCVRNGLKCVSACSGCRGQSCENSISREEALLEEDSDSDFDRNVFDLFV